MIHWPRCQTTRSFDLTSDLANGLQQARLILSAVGRQENSKGSPEENGVRDSVLGGAMSQHLPMYLLFYFMFYCQMDREYITTMFDTCGAHSFVLYKVDKNFLATTSFSDAVFSISPIKQGDQELSIDFGKLFQMKESLQNLPTDIENSLQTVQDFMKEKCKVIPWPSVPSKSNKMYEDAIMVDLAEQVLHPLFEDVTFEPTYSGIVENVAGIKVSNIGIGSRRTFHGMPDLRLTGKSYVIAIKEGLSEIDNEDGDNSPASEGKDEPFVLVFSLFSFCLEGAGSSSSAPSVTGGIIICVFPSSYD